jgi:hypothetical protein
MLEPALDRGRSNYAALAPYTPYIASWSEEETPPSQVIERPGRGIGYLDETVYDRDSRGVLWLRAYSRPRHGEPLFAKVHPLRQRRAMRRLLCNVCAGPANRTKDGILWLLKDHRTDWPGWPEHMAATEPPVCLPCARRSIRMCPALRREGAAAIRVRHAPISGVHGTLFCCDDELPTATEETTIAYGDPRLRWLRAAKLVRELTECTIVDLGELNVGRTSGPANPALRL